MEKKASASRATWPAQVVIAIDIDCFYVACERLRNPALVGKPVGVQQKHILATCSYEARAWGVGKLQGVKDAKRMCPDLILVNGEDLTHYRRYSRAIARMVKSIVWGRKVERLGMDELFCDVTEMVQAHLASVPAPSASPDGQERIWFNLSPASVPPDPENGFYYFQNTTPSLQIPSTSKAHDAQYSPLLAAAAYLAAHIRERIFKELHFTTSAGIAHNKLIAKLVGNLNKPNLQTTWSPDLRTWQQDQEQFIGGFEARKLQGFGHSIANTVQASLAARSVFDPVADNLTVQVVRDHLDVAALRTMFGNRLGDRLHELLHGNDSEPVNPSPEYPVQISVEDSHYGITSLKEAIVELEKLCVHLLQRLGEDLTEDMHGNPLQPAHCQTMKDSNTSTSAYWALYPTALRLTIRQGYDHARQSTSTSFPVDALDDYKPAEIRATALVQRTLAPMLKKLLKGAAAEKQIRITILNVCATNFTKARPDRTIASLLGPSKSKSILLSPGDTLRRDEIDLTQLTTDDEASEEEDKAVHGPLNEKASIANPAIGLVDVDAFNSDDSPKDDLVYVGQGQPNMVTCKVCGSRLFAFSIEAHSKFHEETAGSRTRTSSCMSRPTRQGKKVG